MSSFDDPEVHRTDLTAPRSYFAFEPSPFYSWVATWAMTAFVAGMLAGFIYHCVRGLL